MRRHLKGKSVRLLACTILGAISLSSCDLWYAIAGDPIVGTWTVISDITNGTQSSIGTGVGQYSSTQTYSKDGTITGRGTQDGQPFTGTGTWSRSGTTYTMDVTYSGGLTASATGSLNGDQSRLTWAGTFSGGAFQVVMARQ
jgi:hypothetical protein